MTYPVLTNEPELLARLANGDEHAFTIIYSHYTPIVRKFLLSDTSVSHLSFKSNPGRKRKQIATDIIYFEASGKYVYVITAKGKTLPLSKEYACEVKNKLTLNN